MFARIVRFTDATPEAIAAIVARIEELDAMDAGETPGTLASVDMGKVKVERDS